MDGRFELLRLRLYTRDPVYSWVSRAGLPLTPPRWRGSFIDALLKDHLLLLYVPVLESLLSVAPRCSMLGGQQGHSPLLSSPLISLLPTFPPPPPAGMHPRIS